MSVLTDYFSAPSDEEAARALTDGLWQDEIDVVQANYMLPGYHLLPVESFLTARTEEEIRKDPTSDRVVASVDDCAVVVVALSDKFTTSLAAASSERLAAAAESWAGFEGFRNPDQSGLLEFLDGLSGLARRVVAGEEHLYCKVC